MRTTIRQMLSHKGRMYELFYWLSRGTDWMGNRNKVKSWIDEKEYYYWNRWVTK